MELSLSHTLHLFNIFREYDGKENCAKVLEEECIRMFGTKSLNDEHDCNVISINSLNIHDANDMQSHKLGEAMFDEDDMFSPPSFGEQIHYDENASYKHVNFCGVHWVCKYAPNREDRYCKRHKYLETKLLQESLDVSAENLLFLSPTCELCNERDHFSAQCKLFHDRIVSKNCDDLISLAHHNELSLLLGYEEIKRRTKDIPKFVLDKVLHFDLDKFIC